MKRLRPVELDTPKTEFVIPTSTVIRIITIVAAMALFIYSLEKASHALLLIFTAFFLALSFNSPVKWVASKMPGKYKASRAVGTTVLFLVVVALLGLFLASIVPPLIRQTKSFIQTAPHLVDEVRNQNGPIGNFIRHYHLQNQTSKISHQLASRLSNFGGTAFSTLHSIGSSIFSLITTLALTFMMLVEGPRWMKIIHDLIPRKRRPLMVSLSRDMYQVVQGYVNGQVTLAALASVLITPALFILHISYPIALIVVIFICGLIPMVGHTIGAIIVTFAALFHSAGAALAILIYYLLYQQFENYIIQPRIQANTTSMSPLLVFSSVVVGISFGGLFGGLVAIPVAGCMRIGLLEYLVRHNLIDPPESAANLVPTTVEPK